MTSTPANERSRASTVSQSQSQPHSQPPANLNEQDAADWLAIDRALSHIRSVNPSDPYVLTIPQDVEPRYHHQTHQQARQWLAHAPFSDKEHEASQYLTWHFHEPGNMYVLHSTRPREETDEGSSRVSTPRVGGGGVKKTMSLGAYKKKFAGGTPGPDERTQAEVRADKKEAAPEARTKEGEKSAKKPAVKGPVERVKADEEVLAAVGDVEDVILPISPTKRDESRQDLKRKREGEQAEDDGKAVKRKREDSKISEGPQGKNAEQRPHSNGNVERGDNEQAAKAQQSPKKVAKAQVVPPSPRGEQSPVKKAKTSTPKDVPVASKPGTEATRSAPPERKQPAPPDKFRSPPPKPINDASDLTLPPRLSPLHDDSDSKDDDEDYSSLLPPRLSPTLPDNITATLAARKHFRSTSKSSSAGETLSPPRKALDNGIAKRKSPVNGFRATSSSPMIRSDAEDARGRAKTSAPKVRSPSRSGEESEIAVGKAAALAKKNSAPRLLVKLKFKQRSTRETVKQLLKLPAAKKKPEPKPSPATLQASDARHREQRDVNAKGVAQKVGPATKSAPTKVEKSVTTTPTPLEKRTREDSSEAEARAAKRKKADIAVYEPPAKRKQAAPEAFDPKNSTPSTPSQPPQQPPTPASSKQKPASQPTPSAAAQKKSGNELLAAATKPAGLKREPSHDGHTQVLTPSASSSSPAASSASQQPSASTVPRSTPNATSTPAAAQTMTLRQKEWEAQRKLFTDLGRELKQSTGADITARSEVKPFTVKAEKLRRLAAVKGLESLLAFFLAFASHDEAQMAAEPRQPLRVGTWKTLINYLPFVKQNTEAYPVLQGLVCMLAVVFCAQIVERCLDESKAAEKDSLAQAWKLLSHSAADAEAKLDVRKLETTFPGSWAASVDGALTEEKLEPGKFAGPYRLPLGVQTKPVHAVRAAHVMLREWIEREELGYAMRLKLE